MTLSFRTLRSSSAGNCMVVWTESTRLIIDCGLKSMKRTREVLSEHFLGEIRADAAVFTHMHSDHCGYYPLRVLAESGIDVRVHGAAVDQLRELHFKGVKEPAGLNLRDFGVRGFKVGDLEVRPFEVSHNPSYPTCGFVIYAGNGRKKCVFASDFHDDEQVWEHFVDADLIYVESNHDMELLRRNFNPNSRYHLSNPKCANLLCKSIGSGGKVPKAIVLGHLSEQRNEAAIALGEVASGLREAGITGGRLTASPLNCAGRVLSV